MAQRSVTGPTTLQSAATATGVGTSLTVAGYTRAMLQITGTFAATVTVQATVDGTNWVTYALADISTTGRTRATTLTAIGIYMADDLGGLQAIRANVTAYVSGSITIVGAAST